MRVVAEAPHLRHLAALVLLGTTSAALLEYLFKAKAVETFGPGDHLLRFFALYYAATSLLTFVAPGAVEPRRARALWPRADHEHAVDRAARRQHRRAARARLRQRPRGPRAASRFSAARGSAPAYELFYTPIPAAEKRAAKSVIDVAFDRLGDAVGGGLVRLAILLMPLRRQSSTILWLAIAASLARSSSPAG